MRVSDWREVQEPKIWASRFPRFLDLVYFDWSCHGDKVDFVHAFRDQLECIETKFAPSFLFFEDDREIPSNTKDAFKIIGGLRVISPALHDVLVQFDMTGVQFFEVPILADKNGAISGLPNHYVLNVYGSKDALIPALSENIEKQIFPRESEPRPNAKWRPSNDLDVVALSESAGEGADIWRDPDLKQTLFFSDRLKQAIDAAGLKTKALSFAPARVFTEY